MTENDVSAEENNLIDLAAGNGEEGEQSEKTESKEGKKIAGLEGELDMKDVILSHLVKSPPCNLFHVIVQLQCFFFPF
jgi:hypothetical protein